MIVYDRSSNKFNIFVFKCHTTNYTMFMLAVSIFRSAPVRLISGVGFVLGRSSHKQFSWHGDFNINRCGCGRLPYEYKMNIHRPLDPSLNSFFILLL